MWLDVYKLYCANNNIAVPSFILTGAPFNFKGFVDIRHTNFEVSMRNRTGVVHQWEGRPRSRRGPAISLPKAGVEGSNPFTFSKILKENLELSKRP